MAPAAPPVLLRAAAGEIWVGAFSHHPQYRGCHGNINDLMTTNLQTQTPSSPSLATHSHTHQPPGTK